MRYNDELSRDRAGAVDGNAMDLKSDTVLIVNEMMGGQTWQAMQ